MEQKAAETCVEWLCTAEDASSRVDACLCRHSELSRSRIASLIIEGALTIDGAIETKAAAKVQEGQFLRLALPQARPVGIDAQDIPLDILYQDADIVVVNKPCGMVVHPAAGNESGTLVNALLYHVRDLSGIGGEMRPGIVHRLDKDTSGLILVAKNDRAHAAMSEQFKSRTMEKHYRAVAYGAFGQDQGRIDAPIARHPVDRKKMAVLEGGKPSSTEWLVIQRLQGATYLDVHLLTGRTHQIRVHMHSIGHPLLGDRIYAPNIKTGVRIPRLMLHAYSLAFTHPTTGKRMELTAPLPDAFLQTLQKLT
ncbi:MAG: RluA family pseudouridine synthase [Clostridia bacterium]|nr:RluA family pseudouridine synthase [Clostridia bacterium]